MMSDFYTCLVTIGNFNFSQLSELSQAVWSWFSKPDLEELKLDWLKSRLKTKNQKIAQLEKAVICAKSYKESNPDIVFRLNRSGKIIDSNPKARELFQEKGEFIHQFQQVFQGVDLKKILSVIDREDSFSHESIIKGRTILFRVVGIRENQAANVYGVDITKQKTTQATLFQASKLASVGELASGIGHEINNPLAIIGGSVELLKIDQESPFLENKMDQIASIERAVKRISKVVNGLRTYAKSDATKREVFDFNQCVHSTLDMLGKIYENSGLTLEVELEDKELKVDGIFGNVQEILINIMSNAKDALEDTFDPQIWVQTKMTSDGQVQLIVKDNGPGIPEDIKSKVFEVFYTTKEAGAGSGLGLSVVSNLVKEMKGNIDFTSQAGKGTVFTFTFPSWKESQKESQKKNLEHLRALVIEDEVEVGEFVKMHLESRGLKVDLCENGKDALLKIKEKKYDYVFSDIYMPGKNGYELLSEVREKKYDVGSVIFMTGGGFGEENEELEEKYSFEPDALILKPFQREEIFEMLDEFHPENYQKAS